MAYEPEELSVEEQLELDEVSEPVSTEPLAIDQADNANLARILGMVRACRREEWWNWTAAQAEAWFVDYATKHYGCNPKSASALALASMQVMS